MQQEVILAMLAKEPTHGYELRARLRAALGPVGEDLNAGKLTAATAESSIAQARINAFDSPTT